MEAVGQALSPKPVGLLPHRSFKTFHKADRNFFLGFLAVCWLGVLMGFAHPVGERFAGRADYPAPIVLQIHVFAFSGWLLLLTIQTFLVRAGRQLLHMSLGLVGFALIPVMAVTGLWAEVYSQRYYFDHPPNSQAFLIVPIFYIFAFTVLATTALMVRKTPAAHKRLILLATTVIVGAAYTRWWGERLLALVGDGYCGMIVNTFTGTNLIMAAAVGYDLATRRTIHRTLQIAVAAILAGEAVTSLIYHSPSWLPVARFLIGR